MKTTFAALLLAAFGLPFAALGDDDWDDDGGRWRVEWSGAPAVWVDGPVYGGAYVQPAPPPPVYQTWYYGPPVIEFRGYAPPPYGSKAERKWYKEWREREKKAWKEWRDWDDDD